MTSSLNAKALEALQRLVKTANLLLQNSIGCATNHYGEDYALHGPPGFLLDAESDIVAAQAVLSALPHAGVSEALRCLEELANMPLGISLEDWSRLSSPILAALSSQQEEAVPVACDEDRMPERIWAGDFNARGFGHCVSGPQGGLYAEYVRTDLAVPPDAGEPVELINAAAGAGVEELERKAKAFDACAWYWPEDDTSSEACADNPFEILGNNDAPDGEVWPISRGGVIETRFYASLSAADDSHSDDRFDVDEPTLEAAKAKIEAELTRRSKAKEG